MKQLLRFSSCALAVLVTGCAPQTPPATRETVTLTGSPYEQGLAHGTQLRSKVRSFYTTLLTNSLYPYLSREQPDIASLLSEYDKPRYQGGAFAYQLLLDSAKSMERQLNRATREELQGIADGSGLSYDEVLILNTFVDSVLAVRGIALAIRQGRAPTVESVTLLGLDADGVDNDGDGEVDEADEGVFSPWVPGLGAQAVEAPVGVGLRVVFTDADGVDPLTVRVLFAGTLYTQGSVGLTLTPLDGERLEAVVRPPAPLDPAQVVTVVLSAGDSLVQTEPPPAHASFMRDEELVFTTRGAGLSLARVRRPRLDDGRTRPPSIALGVRGGATADGHAYLAQHFALLDANTSHKHTVVLRHVPESGPAFVTVGWAGVAWGLSGLNDEGLGYVCNPSDTLDNSVVGSVLEQALDLSKAKLLAVGLPIGFAGRRVLERASDVSGARDILADVSHVYGWSCLLGDAGGGLEAVEVDSDIFRSGSGGVYAYGPEATGAEGQRVASVGDDDLIAGSSYALNVDDAPVMNVAGARMAPQRQWSGFYFRSRRAVDAVGRALEAGYGALGPDALEALLAEGELVDRSDSMNAVVLDLKARQLRAAMGAEPATDAPFETTAVRP